MKVFYSSILYLHTIIPSYIWRLALSFIGNDMCTMKNRMLVERSLYDNTNRVSRWSWPPSASDVSRWHLLGFTSIFGSDIRLSTYSWKTSLWYSSDFIFNTVFHSWRMPNFYVDSLRTYYCETICLFLISCHQCTVRKCHVVWLILVIYLVRVFLHIFIICTKCNLYLFLQRMGAEETWATMMWVQCYVC